MKRSHPNYLKEYRKRPEVREHQKLYRQRRDKSKFLEQKRASKRKMTYGIDRYQYAQMLDEQGGLCAICHEPEPSKIRGTTPCLCVDHNHTTGKNRQLLCQKCNRMLGLVGESVLLLEAMIAYLRKHAGERMEEDD